MAIICLLKTSARLESEFAAVAQLARGQFLKDGLTCSRGVSEFPSGHSKANKGATVIIFVILIWIVIATFMQCI